MRAAGDRIGLLTHAGMVANEPEWIELDLEGKLIGRWKLGPEFIANIDTHKEIYSLGQLAFTADARLFAQPYDALSKKYRMMIFDRSTSSWHSSDTVGRPPAHSYMVGAAGNNLAFESRNGGVLLIWIPLTQGR